MKFLLVALVCCTAAYGKTLTPKLSYKQLFFPEGFIVGGTDAAAGEFPYQVSYQNIKEATGKHSHNCGGSIINENYILIAAHCVDPAVLPPNQPKIVAGITKQTEESNGRQEVEVDTITRHPQWSMDTLQNDIAIIKLKTPLTLNDNVKATKLAGPGFTPSDTLTVTGWGLLEQGGSSIPDNLQKVKIPHYPQELCQMLYSVIGVEIQANHICAGGEGELAGVCNGDSGGPLVSADGTQVGIVSFGLGCGSPMFPAVFANVAHFSSWIQETISK
jgi:trypsin